MKEISKAWWNLLFYVAWIWFKELRGRWAIEVQIRDPLKKKKLLKTCILFELPHGHVVNILFVGAFAALNRGICANSRYPILKRLG